uniref:Transcription initiation factor TFIID subunit 10 n=1 Tax=Steinernema glaseri TaxID=37863 RepID=A0A1I7Z5R7_9BILA
MSSLLSPGMWSPSQCPSTSCSLPVVEEAPAFCSDLIFLLRVHNAMNKLGEKRVFIGGCPQMSVSPASSTSGDPSPLSLDSIPRASQAPSETANRFLHEFSSSKVKSRYIEDIAHYEPTLPDAVTQYYANSCGIDLEDLDPRVVRLIAVAAQKFIADIVSDSMLRVQINMNKKRRKRFLHEGSLNVHSCLENETLKKVLEEYEIEVSGGESKRSKPTEE